MYILYGWYLISIGTLRNIAYLASNLCTMTSPSPELD